MPYSMNHGIRLYYEVHGDGPPLILQHGSACSSAEWHERGYCAALQRNYRLILLDARGHGQSDRPHDADAYALPHRVGDVLAVLDTLNIRRAHFFGYSMGGWIGFGLATYAPERLRTLIAGGAHPFAETFQERRTARDQSLEAFIASCERSLGDDLTPSLRARLLTTDLQALHAQTQDRPSLGDALSSMTMPCLLFAGEHEPRLPSIQQARQRMPNATFFLVPGCTHFGAWARSDLVVPHILAFLHQHRQARSADAGG